MTFTITANTNFIRIFRMPKKYPEGFCFAGGNPITFLLIDWFNPWRTEYFWENDKKVISGSEIDESQNLIRKYIKEKIYYKEEFQYLAITDYGDAFII